MALSQEIRKRLFAVLREAGVNDTDERHALIDTYTGGRTHSTKELNDNEALDLIHDLGTTMGSKSDRMRKKIIGIFRSMGVERDGKADMVKIDDWCVQYGYLHKGLNDYRAKELPKLIAQVERVYESWLKKVNK